MVPLRFATRNRWWTLIWAAGVCLTAVSVAGHRAGETDPVPVADPVEQRHAVPTAPVTDSGDLGAAVEALDRSHQTRRHP